MFPAGLENIAVRFVTLVTQTRVRILESGFSGDIDVVMLHGWVASAYSFRHELDSLPALGVHGLAVDFRGFGLSDKPRTCLYLCKWGVGRKSTIAVDPESSEVTPQAGGGR